MGYSALQGDAGVVLHLACGLPVCGLVLGLGPLSPDSCGGRGDWSRAWGLHVCVPGLGSAGQGEMVHVEF